MTHTLIDNTPVEEYHEQGIPVLVKREDRCAPKGAPPFSKIRGIMRHLGGLRDRGVTTVGYTETSISMAGWGVAWACKELGMKAVIFDPQYKDPLKLLQHHRRQWRKYNAGIEPIQAGMARVNWNISKRLLAQRYGPDAVLLPLGLPFEESIEATAQEMVRTLAHLKFTDPLSVVVNVGSGTIAAGVWQGLEQSPLPGAVVYGIMGRTGDARRKLTLIARKAKVFPDGIFSPKTQFTIVDPGWEYTDKSTAPCPFPCHPYYDRKAWQWLTENISNVPHPILFWNIGR